MSRFALIAVAVLIGVVVGLGGFTFGYAKGASYLSTDPAVCATPGSASPRCAATAFRRRHSMLRGRR